MNQTSRIAYSEKHVRRAKLFERQFLTPVFNAIHSQIIAFVRTMRSKGIEAAKREMETVFFNEKAGKAIRELYVIVGLYHANKTSHEITQSVKGHEIKAGFGFNEQWTNDIITFFKMFLLDRAVIPITENTKKQILQMLVKGQEEGWGIDRIAQELQSSELTLWRARLIVRTEIAKAMSYGQELAKRDSKWETQDTWIAAHDHRTRHSHRIVDGDTIGEGGRFKVPVFKRIGKVDVQTGYDVMTGPGDPRASIENIANCRCTKVTRALRDENGRLVPKRQHLTLQ